MFGAGWTEMLIIGIVALVVIGPKDLPVVMRKIGRVVGTVRRMGSEFQNELSKTTGLDQISDLKRSITEPLRQTSDEIVREFNKVTATGVEPSGIMKPLDPKVESVYDQIAAGAGVAAANAPAAAPPVMKPMAPGEPSPAPAEAMVLPQETPAPKVRRAAKPKADSATATAVKPARAAATKPAPMKATPAKATSATAPSAPKAAPAKPAAKAAPRRTRVAEKAAAVTPVTVAANDTAPAKPARTRAKKA